MNYLPLYPRGYSGSIKFLKKVSVSGNSFLLTSPFRHDSRPYRRILSLLGRGNGSRRIIIEEIDLPAMQLLDNAPANSQGLGQFPANP